MDPLADEPEQIDKSPYAAFWNNPILYNDPDGQCPNCATAAGGAIIGGLFGGGIELARQLLSDGKVTSWSAIECSALQGAATGVAAGFTGGASLLTTIAGAGGANAFGGTVKRSIQGNETTVKDVVVDATIGVVLGAGGKAVGNMVSETTNNLSNADKGKLGEAITEIKYGAKGYVSEGKAVVKTGNITPVTGKDAVAKYDHNMRNIFTGNHLTVESKFNKAGYTKNQDDAMQNVTTKGGVIESRTTSQGLGNAATTTVVGVGAGIGAQSSRKPLW